MALHIVLHEPEIPQNTGNIARSCVACGAVLHLIEPMGFRISDKHLKRAGMDYWYQLEYHRWTNLEEFFGEVDSEAELYPSNCFFVSTKASLNHCEITYPVESYFLFGKESAGLPEELMNNAPRQSVRIPMKDDTRSLNLSNAAAIMMYEYWRQHDFLLNSTDTIKEN